MYNEFSVLDPRTINYYVDRFVERWGDTLIPIFYESQKYGGSVQLLGSGVIITKDEIPIWITAKHVIEDGKELKTNLYAQINNQMIVLDKVRFHISKKYDLAIATFPPELIQKYKIASLKSYGAIYDSFEEYKNTKKLFMMGFPGSKNKLMPQYNKIDTNYYGLSFDKIRIKGGEDNITDNYFYDYHNCVDSNYNKARLPQLSGMSGGPLFEIYKREFSPNDSQLRIRLIGILSSIEKKHEYSILNFVKLSQIIEELDSCII